MLRSISVFVFFLFVANGAYAVAPSERDLPRGPDLARFLIAHRKTLARDIYTYHYLTRSAAHVAPSGLLDSKSPALTGHVASWSNYYWDLSQPGGTGMIRGLYLATDPVVSRSFGKDEWLLYRIILRAGTSFLDTSEVTENDATEYLSPAAERVALRAGCKETKWSYVLYKSFDPNCRALALRTLKKLKVALIDYSWQSTEFTLGAKRPDDTFILIDPSVVLASDVQCFYAEFESDDAATRREQAILSALFRHVVPAHTDAPWYVDPATLAPWKDQTLPAVPDDDLRRFLAETEFGFRP